MPPVRARLTKQATPSTLGSSKASTTMRWLAPRILIAVVTSPISSAARRAARAAEGERDAAQQARASDAAIRCPPSGSAMLAPPPAPARWSPGDVI